MFSLQSLREARTIVRWMLVWFALSIGVAVAAPVVNPQALTLICTTAGNVKFVSDSAGDSADALPSGMQAHALDCVMCLPVGAAPVSAPLFFVPVSARALQPAAPPAHTVSRPIEAASARGPPAHA